MQAQRQPVTEMTRCLVIEDNLLDQKMIQRSFAGARVSVELEFATTLRAAQRLLATNRFSIILCDNNLPDGNGTDFAKELAEDPKYRGVRIVIVSGWPSPFMWDKAKMAGLQVIDKNDQPQVKLMKVLNLKSRQGQPRTTASVTMLRPAAKKPRR